MACVTKNRRPARVRLTTMTSHTSLATAATFAWSSMILLASGAVALFLLWLYVR